MTLTRRKALLAAPLAALSLRSPLTDLSEAEVAELATLIEKVA